MAFHLDIVSPEESLFEGDVEFLRTKTVEGEIGILTGHTPILAQLVACETKVRDAGGAESFFQIGGGFMTVKDNKAIILAEEAVPETAPAAAST
ncbi:MAG: F0F1 ATP synthase subunit epsilon [Actinomycetota bacterium]